MNNLEAHRIILIKLNEYVENKEVKKVLLELLDELNYDDFCLEGLICTPVYAAIFDPKEQITYEEYFVYAICKNLNKRNKLFLSKRLRQRFNMSFSDSMGALKEDKVLILNDCTYKAALEEKNELEEKGIDSWIVVKGHKDNQSYE